MKQGSKTKSLILDEANRLFYQQGFNSTPISHIETATGLSKGNITYHFKSKRDILVGIIEKRLIEIEHLLSSWNKDYLSPTDRLIRFCEMLIDEQENLVRYGCPMGTLTTEFSKNKPDLYQISLPMFNYFKRWLIEQFILLNCSAYQANENALALLARVQGISVITHVFKDKKFMSREIAKLKEEVRAEYADDINRTPH